MSIADYLLPSLATWLIDGFLKDGWVTNQVYTNRDYCLYVDNEVICFYENREIKKYSLTDNTFMSFVLCKDEYHYKTCLQGMNYPFLIGFIAESKGKILLVNVLTLSIINEWSYDENDPIIYDAFGSYHGYEWDETKGELIIAKEQIFEERIFKVDITYRPLSFADTKLHTKNHFKSWTLDTTTFSFASYPNYEFRRLDIANNIFNIYSNNSFQYLDSCQPICRHVFKHDFRADLFDENVMYSKDINNYCVVYLKNKLINIIQYHPPSFYKYKSCTCKITIE